MFAEHAFDVKHLGNVGRLGFAVTPRRDDGDMPTPDWPAIEPEAERIGERIPPIRARPWPERPVSAANKSGKDPVAARPALTNMRSLLVPSRVSSAPASVPCVRLPETVYRRRRLAVAGVAVAALALVLAVARPDGVPPGESNPWPAAGDASLSAEAAGVYVVQPGDTLWAIALAVAPGDPRAAVHDLSEVVEAASLEPGQRISLEAERMASDPAHTGESTAYGASPAAGVDR